MTYYKPLFNVKILVINIVGLLCSLYIVCVFHRKKCQTSRIHSKKCIKTEIPASIEISLIGGGSECCRVDFR